MPITSQEEHAILEKIRELPPEKVAEVEDFIDSLNQGEDRQLVLAAMKVSEESFREVWDNPDDAEYDKL